MLVLPHVTFSPWRPWKDVIDRTWKELDQTGAYALARFEVPPPTGPADPTTPEVFYIGEAHGRTSCLRNRLRQFGDSAGFSGHQKGSHYAAWDYLDRFPQDQLPSRPMGPVADSGKVYVAVCHYDPQPGWPGDARGVFPMLAESTAIWLHVQARGGLPVLNNSGWQGTSTPVALPAGLSPLVTRLLSGRATAKEAKGILELLAKDLGYGEARKLHETEYDEWTEVERHLGGRIWLGIGWRGEGADREFRLDLYEGDEPLLCLPDDNRQVKTYDEITGMFERFWNYWHQP